MGIRIENKIVYYDDSHSDLLITCKDLNPTMTKINGITVHSIFRRVQNKDRNITGDGNPAIFALKRYKGYGISKEELIKFLPSFNFIIEKIIRELEYDTVVALPSSHNIAKTLAIRISRANINANLSANVFRKNTNDEVLQSFRVKSQNVKLEIELNKLRTLSPHEDFTIKSIATKQRKHFEPIRIDSSGQIGKNIIIVDDLMATGSTLKAAIKLLETLNPDCKITCLCLFSKL